MFVEILEIIIHSFQNLYRYFHIEKVCRAHSSAWLERPAHNRSAGGSNPLGPTNYEGSNTGMYLQPYIGGIE
jgi:hypothetical protein